MIASVGVDWESAPVEVRELFAIPKSAEPSFMVAATHACDARGCVLLKTCNRFELYLDLPEDRDPASLPVALRDLVLSLHDPREVHMTPELFCEVGDDACRRLMTIACGLRSQVLGEDQIITQVRDAQTEAREAGVITAELETLFRIAVTCGKAVRTNVAFHQEGTSCARTAVELAERELGRLDGVRALVIGNGEMGRLAASLLVERGAETFITLRTYRHGATLVPAGCGAIPYDSRVEFLEGCAVALSATKSQHTTLSFEDLEGLSQRPQVICDLAMPRDVDPRIAGLDGTRLFDLDDMRDGTEADVNAEALAQARAIIDEHLEDFREWRENRARRLARATADVVPSK